MARRYSRILDAARLAQAVDNYVTYIQTAATRPRRIGQGAPRPVQVDLAIDPFTITTAATDLYLGRAGQPSRAFLGTEIGTAAVEVGGAVVAKKVPGWSPAKITVGVMTGTATVATSAVTGLQYLKYAGTTYSHPFGKKVATDSEFDVFQDIKAALAGPNRRFSIKSEAYRLQ